MEPHRVLQVPEVLHQIFEHMIAPTPKRSHRSGISLISAARCCKIFSPVALRILWRDMDSIFPLLQIIPGFKYLKSERKYNIQDPVSKQQWERFEFYASCVHTLFHGNDNIETQIIDNFVFALLSQHFRGRPICPSLTSIHLHGPSLLPLFISPTVQQIKFTVSAPIRSAFLDVILETSPSIHSLSLIGSLTRDSCDMLSRFEQLRHLRIERSHCSIYLDALSSFRYLAKLELCANEPLSRTTDDFKFSARNLPALRSRYIEAPPKEAISLCAAFSNLPLDDISVRLIFPDTLATRRLDYWMGLLLRNLGAWVETLHSSRLTCGPVAYSPRIPTSDLSHLALLSLHMWPKLRFLKLGFSSPISPAGLKCLAENLPQLRTLSLPVDFSNGVETELQGSFVEHKLEFLNVWPLILPAKNLMPAAHFLSQLFPSVKLTGVEDTIGLEDQQAKELSYFLKSFQEALGQRVYTLCSVKRHSYGRETTLLEDI